MSIEKETEQSAPGQRVLQAPEGCGFHERPVLPVQVSLMCKNCSQPMYCKAQMPPLLVEAPGGSPPRPDYLHECPACQKTVRMKQPWPTIRYAPHPTFDAASPEQQAEQQAEYEAEMERQRALIDALAETGMIDKDDEDVVVVETPETSEEPLTEAAHDSSSEEE